MPTYTYACRKCEQRVDVVLSFDDDHLTECADCGGTLRRVFKPAGIVFRGSGWHIKDYAETSGGGAGPADGGDSSDGDGSSNGDGDSSGQSSDSSTDTARPAASTASSSTSTASGSSSSAAGGSSAGSSSSADG